VFTFIDLGLGKSQKLEIQAVRHIAKVSLRSQALSTLQVAHKYSKYFDDEIQTSDPTFQFN